MNTNKNDFEVIRGWLEEIEKRLTEIRDAIKELKNEK